MRQGLIAARLSTKRRPLIGLASGRFNVRTRARDNSRAGLHTPNAPNYQFSKSRLPGTTTWQSSLLGRAAVASHRTVLSRGEACDPKVAPVSSHSKEHPRTALPTCLDPLSRTGTGGVGRRLGWASLVGKRPLYPRLLACQLCARFFSRASRLTTSRDAWPPRPLPGEPPCTAFEEAPLRGPQCSALRRTVKRPEPVIGCRGRRPEALR